MDDEFEGWDDDDRLMMDLGMHPSGEAMRPGEIRPDTGDVWDPLGRPEAEAPGRPPFGG